MAGSDKPTRRPATKASPKPAAGKTVKKPAAKKAAAKKAAPRRKTAATDGPTNEQIAERAYMIHQAEGGEPVENWLRAERELKAGA